MENFREKMNKREPRAPKVWEALISLLGIMVIMAIGIVKFKTDPHIPMFIGVILASIIAYKIGYKWMEIERMMLSGIMQALQAIMILMIVGMMVGVWLLSGTIPSMIYYGMKLLKPSYFLATALIISAITSLATGSSWGTMGTMGIGLIGIASGLGVPLPAAAGAIVSGAYFGDKLSPLSETTNLAPAVSGTDVFSHVKYMMKGTVTAFIIALAFYTVYGIKLGISSGNVDTSNIQLIMNGIKDNFNINPILLLPPIVVIVTIVLKVPALPGITFGLITAAILSFIFQGASLGDLLICANSGYECHTGVEVVDTLLTHGGLMSMSSAVLISIIAMMFGGIMEGTGQLDVLVSKFTKYMKSSASLVLGTELTCIISNITIPDQYISILGPGRMYAPVYRERGLHPKVLSNALESAGTVSAPLIPWTTGGMYIKGLLGISAVAYGKFAVFNWVMPIVTAIFAYIGWNVTYMTEEEKEEAELGRTV